MTRLGKRRRQIAIVLVVVGLFSALAPTIETQPPVMGRSYWSILEVARTAAEGGLPDGRDIPDLIGALAPFAIAYLLLIFALALLCLFPDYRLLGRVAMFGIVACTLGLREVTHDPGSRRLFYGVWYSRADSVNYWELVLILFVVMMALLLISVAEGMDSRLSKKQIPQSEDDLTAASSPESNQNGEQNRVPRDQHQVRGRWKK